MMNAPGVPLTISLILARKAGVDDPAVEEAINKIFIPFYTTKKTGSGIGLALSRQIMQMHGGSLTVVSEPGVITTFTLKF